MAALFRRTPRGGVTRFAPGAVTLALLAARSFLTRRRIWLWTEWAALASASIIAGCWVYDEFVARPALDRTVRVALLGAWLLAIAVLAAVLIRVWRSLQRRLVSPTKAT